ncbi:MAG: hypothetical protein ACOC71_05160 [Hyphomicrobiales bacterium]
MCNHHEAEQTSASRGPTRRAALTAGLAPVAGAGLSGATQAQDSPYEAPAEPALPASDMVLRAGEAALVVTDPQVDFLSPDGVT